MSLVVAHCVELLVELYGTVILTKTNSGVEVVNVSVAFMGGNSSHFLLVQTFPVHLRRKDCQLFLVSWLLLLLWRRVML